jgi:predicted PurR-regulated permease PerM
MFSAYLLLGVPGAFLGAGATFIFAWIPVLGSTPVWVFGTGYLWFQDSPARAVIMLAVGLICSASDNLVRPLILRGRGDMHPLVSLVAIFGGIEMFGIFGVFIGPILAAILMTLFQIWPVIARRFGLMPESATNAPTGAVASARENAALPIAPASESKRKAG